MRPPLAALSPHARLGVEPPGIVLRGPHGHPSAAESHLVADRGMSGSKRLNDLARSHMEETMVQGQRPEQQRMPSWTINGVHHRPLSPALLPSSLISPTAKHGAPNPQPNASGVARNLETLTTALCSMALLTTSMGKKTEAWGGQ